MSLAAGRRVARGLVGMLAAAALATGLRAAGAVTSLPLSPSLTLAAQVDNGWVLPGEPVTYTVYLTNAGDGAATDVAVAHRLPSGFAYVRGSAKVYRDGVLISAADPAIEGLTLRWSGLTAPPRRGASFYGINTFVQERCESGYLHWQLDRARELAGPGGWVKQLFYGITPSTQAAAPCWVEFVNAAYDRGLRPVLRLQGLHGGDVWLKPPADGPGNYASIAQAYRRVVASLPRRDGHRLYVQIWNEPNLNLEWGGAANPAEYGAFLAQTAAAIRGIGDSRIVLLNGPLSPGGNIAPLDFMDRMVSAVPASLWAFDLWAAHPYPGNHPPEYNIHGGTAVHRSLTIDSYLLELERLAARDRPYLSAFLSETGYDLGNNTFGWEGFPAINEQNRADYMARAFRDYWHAWPEVDGVAPYELLDPQGVWTPWDWLRGDGSPRPQFSAVAALDKSAPQQPSVVRITFRATAASTPGVYPSHVSATAGNAVVAPLPAAAPVTVLGPVATP
ncbi:MAG: DUF11 domain-containing protein, partial [Caldilineales bacterium]|nr:DUF11 domain-containing protein [Caldilineales bacterium]